MTVRDLITGSLRLIGAVATGETPSAAEQADALLVLNELLESWSIEDLLVYQVTRETFTLTADQGSRTIGATGNFVTTRPVQIMNAGVVENSIEYPLEIITSARWAEISNKSHTSTRPEKLYAEGTFPNETINLWPVPSAASSIVLYSQKVLSSFTSANDTVSLPPGYSKTIRYNLALELAPEYGKAPSEIVMITAQTSKTDLKRQNTKPVFMKSDVFGLAGVTHAYDILKGE